MNDQIHHLLTQIKALEDELSAAIHEQESRIFFQIKGKRVEFEDSIRKKHLEFKKGFFRWLVTNRPQNLITGPVIYIMIIPLLIIDLCVSLYQAICFPIYKIAKVKRADYLIFDRQHLDYLNWVEKFHCTYCAYATGLIAYLYEIIARTEQYFCPIKHARKILGTHARYASFLAYGDAEIYEDRLEEFRNALSKTEKT